MGSVMANRCLLVQNIAGALSRSNIVKVGLGDSLNMYPETQSPTEHSTSLLMRSIDGAHVFTDGLEGKCRGLYRVSRSYWNTPVLYGVFGHGLYLFEPDGTVHRIADYHISFELIGLNGANKNSFFQNSHNRRIYSNYFTISCDHQIAAFCRSKSRCSQSIEILKHFSKLDKDGSDQPVKGHNAFVGKLSESISDWMRHVNYEATYRVAKNGNYRLTIHHLENRLVAPNTK